MIESQGDLILTAIGIVGAFGIGCWLGQRRVCAILDVVDAYRDQARTYYEAADDGTISDEEARAIVQATRRFFLRLDAARALFTSDLVEHPR